jgi:hypothetical protein
MKLTAARLKELLDYDPATGIFRWRKATSKFSRVTLGVIAGALSPAGYRHIKIDGRVYQGHRLAWQYVYGEGPDGDLDHKDRNRDNNSIANLRLANDSQNQANSHHHVRNSSGFKGVCWNKKSCKWQSGIKRNGRSLHLGLFETAEEAHAVYMKKATELYGEFARGVR